MPLPRCEICGSFLVCETDSFTLRRGPDGKMFQGYGKMSYVHDGPCVVPEHRSEKQSPVVDGIALTKRCVDCPTLFEIGSNTRHRQRCDPCRVKRERKLALDNISKHAKTKDAA